MLKIERNQNSTMMYDDEKEIYEFKFSKLR